MKHIITPVGTSIYSNYFHEQVNSSPIYEYYQDLLEKPSDEWDNHTRTIAAIKRNENFRDWIKSQESKVSAELTSLSKIIDLLGEDEYVIHLISSDTVLSRLAAELIFETDILGAEFQFKDNYVISGLQVNNVKVFQRQGLPNLIKTFDTITGKDYENVVLDITGGYKVLIPYLTILGQVNSIPLYYIFEESRTLMEVPQAPIDINWGMFEKYSEPIRLLQNTVMKDWESFKREHDLAEDFQACVEEIRINDTSMLGLNAIGRIFWHRYQKWQIVHVLRNAFSRQSIIKNRTHITRAIEGLLNDLHRFIESNQLQDSETDEIYQNLINEGHDTLNHANKNTEYLISKYHSANPEIRLLYNFDYQNGEINKLKIYDFRIGRFDHSTYIKEFEEFYRNNKDGEFVPYLQIKLLNN